VRKVKLNQFAIVLLLWLILYQDALRSSEF